MKKFLLFFAVLLTALTTQAENYILYTSTDGKIVEPQETFGEAKIVSNTYANGMGRLVFDRDLQFIQCPAFSGCNTLSAIVIPNSVVEVTPNTFIYCPNLASFSGKFATEDNRCLINEYNVMIAFAPSGLASFDIPNHVVAIEANAFEGSVELEKVTIPSSVVSIGWGAFGSCESMKSIEIPGTVQRVSNSVFFGCTRLESFTGPYASEDHRCLMLERGVLHTFAPAGLDSYVISDNFTIIGEDAFYGCENLKTVEIPATVKEIKSTAFAWCTGLKTISLPSSVTTLDEGVFGYCTGLTSFQVPSSITTLPSNLFEYCTNLASVTLPCSVDSLGGHVFEGCDAMAELISLNPTPPAVNDEGHTFEDMPTSTCVLKVPVQSVEAYRKADGWKEFFNIVGIDNTGLPLIDAASHNGTTYNLSGQPVSDDFHGIVVRESKKLLKR